VLAAALVGEHPAGNPVQPRAGGSPGRHFVDPPPGGEERLGDDVGGIVGAAGAAQRVAEDGGAVDGIHLLEPPTPVVRHPFTWTTGRNAWLEMISEPTAQIALRPSNDTAFSCVMSGPVLSDQLRPFHVPYSPRPTVALPALPTATRPP
jgi:hypothetical protein